MHSPFPALLLATLAALPGQVRDTDPFPPATPESQGLASEALAELVTAVAGYLEKGELVGAELLVVKNRRTILHEVFGWRDRERELAMERHTICNVRSMTKPLTGAAVQILVDEGRLGLDDPVAKHLPAFDDEKCRAITLRQLLTHRSGLPLTVLTESVRQYDSLQAIAEAAGARGPEFEPDSKFWYSDAGSDVAGAVVEAVSGQRLDELVHERLLAPLGMSDSFYRTPADDPRRERIASLYVGSPGSWSRFWKPDDEPFYPFAWGSQTLYSTPRDYARFLAMWMDGGTCGERRVLSREALTRTLTPTSPMSTLGSDAPYPTSFRGVRAYYGQMAILWMPHGAAAGAAPVAAPVAPVSIGHSGSDGTYAWAFPAQDLMVLYFTQSRGAASGLRLERVIDRALLHPGEELTEEVPDELRPFLGTYLANFGQFQNAEFKVLVQNGNLAVDVPGQLVFELKEPDAEGKRYFVLTAEIAVSFDRGEDRVVTGMKLYQAGMTFELPKKG